MRCSAPVKNTPVHLYARGEYIYFRLRIPKKWIFQCDVAELRFSLQTDSRKEAKHRVGVIMMALQTLFKEKEMVSREDLEKVRNLGTQLFSSPKQFEEPKYSTTSRAMHEWLHQHGHSDYTLAEVANKISLHMSINSKEFSFDKLTTLLKGDSKTELTYEDAHRRLIGLHRHLLAVNSQDISSRTLDENRALPQSLLGMTTSKDVGITTKNILNLLREQCKIAIDNPPLLCLCSVAVLEQLVEDKIFVSTELSHKNHLVIVNEFFKISLEYLTILLARLKKDYSKEKTFLALPYETYPLRHETNEKNIRPRSSRHQRKDKDEVHKQHLSSFLENYLDTKVKDGKKDARYIPELKKHLELFLQIARDKPIDVYERLDFRHFRDTLQKLPPRFSRRKDLQDKTIDEIASMSHEECLKEKTINAYILDVSAFFNWLVQEGHLDKNHAQGLSLKETQNEIDARNSFTLDDLRKIFQSERLTAYKKSETPAKFWVPWIGLYTGMRLEEICQLHCTDIYQLDSIWVIDVNENQGKDGEKTKNTKSFSANRVIPIHQKLIDLGFLDYLKKTKEKHERLFPDLSPIGDRKQYGKMLGKFFGNFVRGLGIEGKKSFHSLRHTFSDFYKKKMLHNTIFEQIFGHTHERLATRRYGERFSPQQCYEELIAILDYEL